MEKYYNLFEIGIGNLNLLSFILGGMWGLSTSCFNRYRQWWIVAAYFVAVAIYFAAESGHLHP